MRAQLFESGRLRETECGTCFALLLQSRIKNQIFVNAEVSDNLLVLSLFPLGNRITLPSPRHPKKRPRERNMH